MLTRSTEFLLRYMDKKQKIPEKKYELYKVSLQISIEIFINLVLSIAIGSAMNMFKECILFLGMFILLRAFAGGAHLENALACAVFSILSLIGILILIARIQVENKILFFGIMGAMVTIKLLAPVEHVNRPLREGERERFAKRLNIVLAATCIMSIVSLILEIAWVLKVCAVTQSFMIFILVAGKVAFSKTKK